MEAYVFDVVVKTGNPDDFISNLQETFDSLRKFRWKLNPTKYVFGVPLGELLSFIISHRGIEANLEKITAITDMKATVCMKDIQKLTGCTTALNRFISRLGGWGLLFFKQLKKQDKFQWTPEAIKALVDLQKLEADKIARVLCITLIIME